MQSLEKYEREGAMKIFSILSLLVIPLFSLLLINGCGDQTITSADLNNDSIDLGPTLRMSEEDMEAMENLEMDIAEAIKNQALALRPAAPSSLYVISQIPAPYYNKVTLGWKDNSTNEEGFRIYRAQCVQCQCDGDLSWKLVGNTGVNVVSFSDIVPKSTNPYLLCHSYVVAAFNSYGDRISNRVMIGIK